MFTIVVHHLNVSGWIRDTPDENFITELLRTVLSTFDSNFGNTIFALIAGYFGINSAPSFQRPIKLFFRASIFSAIVFLILCFLETIFGTNFITDPLEISISRSFFPVLFQHYWFVNAIIGLYILAPILNSGIKSISRQQFRTIILVFIAGISVLPFFGFSIGWDTRPILVFLAYLIGSYIRLYGYGRLNLRKRTIFLLEIILVAILVGYIWVFHLAYQNPAIREFGTIWFRTKSVSPASTYYSNIFGLALSVLSLIFFLKLNLGYSKFIQYISYSVFAIYLVHDQFLIQTFIRSGALKDFFHYSSFLGLMGTLLIYAAGLFLASLAIGIFIDRLITDPLWKLVERGYYSIRKR